MNKYLLILVYLLPSILLAEGADFMRSTGKINVVFGVIFIIFIGIIIYLIRLDKKIIKLEKSK